MLTLTADCCAPVSTTFFGQFISWIILASNPKSQEQRNRKLQSVKDHKHNSVPSLDPFHLVGDP